MSVVVFLAIVFVGFVGHGFILGKDYEAMVGLWRPMGNIQRLLPLGWLSDLIASFLFVYIYHKGYEGKTGGIAEGARFGLIIGLFTAIPMTLWSYVMMPISISMAIAWFFIGMVMTLVAGLIVGAMYKRSV